MLTPTAVIAVVVTMELAVEPTPIAPFNPWEGANTVEAPAPKVPTSAGFSVNCHAFVTMLKRFSTVAEAS